MGSYEQEDDPSIPQSFLILFRSPVFWDLILQPSPYLSVHGEALFVSTPTLCWTYTTDMEVSPIY